MFTHKLGKHMLLVISFAALKQKELSTLQAVRYTAKMASSPKW